MPVRYQPTLLCALLLSLCGCREKECDTAPRTPRRPVAIADARLHNAFKFTEKVWGGSEPDGEEAFKALQAIGVKTIISVDGAKPNAELAAKHGLRYVHLPIGYDEVPAERAREMAKAFDQFSGPVYVHCHHGKHRSPAALGTACVVAGLLTNDEALLAMKVAGTGENYTGLWDSAKNARPIDRNELKAMNVQFVERAPVPPMAEAMVEIDHAFSNLKECQKAGWKQPRDHPDLEPAHEALKLREHYTEYMRAPEYSKKPADFKRWMEASEAELKAMESALRLYKGSVEKAASQEINAAFVRVEQSCKDCHAAYRNVKGARR